MGSLSGKPEIQSYQLDGRLAYLEAEMKLMIFRKNEEDRFSNALARYGQFASKDSQAAQELRRAASRQARVAAEILRRRGEMAPAPIGITAVQAAWQKAYLAYSEYANAEAAAWEARASRVKSSSKQPRKLLMQSQSLRDKALKEQAKFAKRLKLSDEAADKLIADATAFVAAENWRPKESSEETIAPEGER